MQTQFQNVVTLLSLELLLERDFLLLRVVLTSEIGRRGSDLIRG